MKRSGSDWDLDEFLRPVEDDDRSPSPDAAFEDLLFPRAAQKPRVGRGGGAVSFADFCCGELGFEFGDRDAISSYSPGRALTRSQIWSTISATIIESQSSICGSPTSPHKPKGTENQTLGGTSGSEQSDDESLEIEAGLCDQSTDVLDLKRMRRMVSNRESARRSRKRKQAHLAELELQVDQLRGENANLYKQLTDANQQFGEAATDNRVLKSDVEALRVKVKMAEDLVTRGPSTCSMDHLLHNHIGSTQLLSARNPCRSSEVPPTLQLPLDEACYVGAAAGQVQNNGSENREAKNRNISIRVNQSSSPLQSIARLEGLQNRITSDVTSCEAADVWSWDSHGNATSKQL